MKPIDARIIWAFKLKYLKCFTGNVILRLDDKWASDINEISILKAVVWVKTVWKKVSSEAALQWCSYEKVFWKYAANLQQNTHAEMRF